MISARGPGRCPCLRRPDFSCSLEILQQKKREEAEAEQMRAAMEEWNRQHRAKSLREMAEAGKSTSCRLHEERGEGLLCLERDDAEGSLHVKVAVCLSAWLRLGVSC